MQLGLWAWLRFALLVLAGVLLVVAAAAHRPPVHADDVGAEPTKLARRAGVSVGAEAGRMDPEQARRIAHRRVEELLQRPTSRLADDIP